MLIQGNALGQRAVLGFWSVGLCSAMTSCQRRLRAASPSLLSYGRARLHARHEDRVDADERQVSVLHVMFFVFQFSGLCTNDFVGLWIRRPSSGG
jgi:hypothetical protein